jgi:hypothetical protein
VTKTRGRADHHRISVMRFREAAYLSEGVSGSDHELCVDAVGRCDVLDCSPKLGFDVILMSLFERDAGAGAVRGSQESTHWMTDVDGNE